MCAALETEAPRAYRMVHANSPRTSSRDDVEGRLSCKELVMGKGDYRERKEVKKPKKDKKKK